MANVFIKAQKVVSTALGVLEREITLPNLVWRDAGGNFIGAAGDTITIRVPSYLTARTRVLRGGRPITVDQLDETSVTVTLDTDVYKAISVTDEEMTLDIVSFGLQVAQPVVQAVARGVEDNLNATLAAAPYHVTVAIDASDPYLGLVDMRTALNDARVPSGNRYLAVGSGVEAALLKSDRLSNFINVGDNTALREATIGNIAGFTAISNPVLAPGSVIAFHQTAFVLSMQAPVVPAGATWGESASYSGLAMRVLRDYDFLNVQDRFLADVFVGSNYVQDRGTYDSAGKFQPDPAGTATPLLVRAVKGTIAGMTSS